MMAMYLSCRISAVLQDSRDQRKRNGDGMTRRICNPNWILLRALISMGTVSDSAENERNILQKNDGPWNRYCSIIILALN